MNAKLVTLGAEHDCTVCRKSIPAKARAWKSTRKAETFHERAHADRHGHAVWYRCEPCHARGEARV